MRFLFLEEFFGYNFEDIAERNNWQYQIKKDGFQIYIYRNIKGIEEEFMLGIIEDQSSLYFDELENGERVNSFETTLDIELLVRFVAKIIAKLQRKAL